MESAKKQRKNNLAGLVTFMQLPEKVVRDQTNAAAHCGICCNIVYESYLETIFRQEL